MFVLSFVPVIFYFVLEFFRVSPIEEARRNRGSSAFVGAVLMCMIVLPCVLHFSVYQGGLSIYEVVAGIAVGVVGVWIRTSAISMLGRFYSRNVGIQSHHQLIETGWYRHIRHPGYLGTLLTYVGFAYAAGAWWAVVINVSLFFVAYTYRIRVEEETLRAEFKEPYDSYQRRTWRLIPFVY